MNGIELFRNYVDRGCQDSFASLVRLHVNLVFGTAVRQVRDPQLAQDISQKVFCALAQNAKSIRNPAVLPAWLYRTTCQLAALHFRTEERRIQRERFAVTMNLSPQDHENPWEQVEPLLDQALAELGEKDRLAVLVRFFEAKPMAEVAARLGISEGAAKMRVGRAVEKLRGFFARRGVACSGAGLVLALEQRTNAAVPPSTVQAVLEATKETLMNLSSTPTGHVQIPVVSSLQNHLGIVFVAGIIVVVTLTIGWKHFGGAFPASRQNISASSAGGNSSIVPGAVNPIATREARISEVGSNLRLTVLDRDTARPVAGVRVSASNLGERLGESVTGGDGRCDLPIPKFGTGDFYYRLQASRHGYVMMDVSWSRFQQDQTSDIPPEFVLSMPRGARVGGTVVDAKGSPLSGVELVVQNFGTSGGPASRARAELATGGNARVKTDGMGRWVFDQLPPDWTHTHFIASTPEYQKADYVSDFEDLAFGEGQLVAAQDLLDERAVFALKAGIPIRGRIVEDGGQGIPGAVVVQDFKWFDGAERTTSRKDGTFEMLNASTGSLYLTVQAPRFAARKVKLVVDGPITNAMIVLKPGYLLYGRVTDEESNAVANAEVDIGPGDSGQPEFQWNCRTDDDGKFAWDGAPGEAVPLIVGKSGFETREVLMAATNGANAVTLKRRPELGTIIVEGKVSDDTAGNPIKEFQIQVSEDQMGFGPAREGHGGAFVLPVYADAKSYAIRIRADGYADSTITRVIGSERTTQLTFRLTRASGWSGIVLLPNGEPASDAEVGISTHLHTIILGDRRVIFREEARMLRRTDASGEFHLDPASQDMAAGRVLVAVHAHGFAEYDADRFADNLVVKLQSWGRVEGVLRTRVQPSADVKVSIARRDWNPWTAGVLLYPGQFWTKTDAQGDFVIESVPPGDYEIGCDPRGSVEARATVTVLPGRTAQVAVGGDGHAIVGRILAPERGPGFDFSLSRGHLKRQQAKPVDLPRVSQQDFSTEEAYKAAARKNAADCVAYWQSAEGLAAWREHRTYSVAFEPDGKFHADDIPPGEYTLDVFLEAHIKGMGPSVTRPVSSPLRGVVSVPRPENVEGGHLLNVGTVNLKPW